MVMDTCYSTIWKAGAAGLKGRLRYIGRFYFEKRKEGRKKVSKKKKKHGKRMVIMSSYPMVTYFFELSICFLLLYFFMFNMLLIIDFNSFWIWFICPMLAFCCKQGKSLHWGVGWVIKKGSHAELCPSRQPILCPSLWCLMLLYLIRRQVGSSGSLAASGISSFLQMACMYGIPWLTSPASRV